MYKGINRASEGSFATLGSCGIPRVASYFPNSVIVAVVGTVVVVVVVAARPVAALRLLHSSAR
jgi:hypothetical protein